jgi:hypothetical protein
MTLFEMVCYYIGQMLRLIYIVSVEGHNVHLHLYSKFRDNTKCAALRECVSNFEGVVDIKL